jgi:quinol monooxygenase YgiN
MTCTVVVIFQAKPGLGGRLSEWLARKHPDLRAHAGFDDISLHRDAADPDRIVEIEHWAEAADHQRMVERLDEQGGWDELGQLIVAEPTTLYLERVGS